MRYGVIVMYAPTRHAETAETSRGHHVNRASLFAGVAIAALALGGCGPVGADQAGTAAAASTPSTGSTPPPTAAAPTTTSIAPLPDATGTSSTATGPDAPPTTAPPAAGGALIAPGTGGDTVRELQARLKQLEWYDGDVTGTYDDPTTAGVRGFQDKRTLPVTGSVDKVTWASLTGRTRQPTDDEMHNRLVPGPALLAPGATGPRVRDLQARLKQIGWWTGAVADSYSTLTVAAVKGFQDKRRIPVTGEVDQRTLDTLLGMTRTPTKDELANVTPTRAPVTAAGLDPRCLTGHVLCISKRTRSLTWVVDGTAKLRVAVRFGSENTPTREGSFTVYRKNRDWTSTLFGSKMPYSMFFSGGEAVHYSSDFAARGYAGASHGCVNVRDLGGIAWLFDQVAIGDHVVVS